MASFSDIKQLDVYFKNGKKFVLTTPVQLAEFKTTYIDLKTSSQYFPTSTKGVGTKYAGQGTTYNVIAADQMQAEIQRMREMRKGQF